MIYLTFYDGYRITVKEFTDYKRMVRYAEGE